MSEQKLGASDAVDNELDWLLGPLEDLVQKGGKDCLWKDALLFNLVA